MLLKYSKILLSKFIFSPQISLFLILIKSLIEPHLPNTWEFSTISILLLQVISILSSYFSPLSAQEVSWIKGLEKESQCQKSRVGKVVCSTEVKWSNPRRRKWKIQESSSIISASLGAIVFYFNSKSDASQTEIVLELLRICLLEWRKTPLLGCFNIHASSFFKFYFCSR